MMEYLLDVNMSNREAAKSYFENNGAAYFKYNFCTITLSLGRRAGHTTFIENNFNTLEDVIVYPKHYMAEEFKRRNKFRREYNRIISAHSLKGCSWMPIRDAKFVFVDCASMLRHEEMDRIYGCLATNDFYQTFVLLS